jgi:DNA mismatch endonuclease (patch repair protein)
MRRNRPEIPKSSSIHVRNVMKANRSSQTGPEVELCRELEKRGITGYLRNCRRLVGSPDLAFFRERTAVFVQGCFWHRCPHCKFPMPRTHTEYWAHKFEMNIHRDLRVRRALNRKGWHVVIAWECEIKSDPSKVVARIGKVLHACNRGARH